MNRHRCQKIRCAVWLAGILWGCLSASGIGWSQPLTQLPPDLKTYITEALQSNPEIKRLADLKKASQEAIRPAGSLDDPMLTFGFFNLPVNTFSLNQEDMTQKSLGVSQKIPFPGKRRLRSEVAVEQARADDFALLDKLNETRSKVIQAYWGLSLAHSSYEITEKNKHFWEQVVQVAETRYATGQGQQADVLQSQVELGNYLDRLLQWRQKQDSLRAELNALRDRPAAHCHQPSGAAAPPVFYSQTGRDVAVLGEPAPGPGLKNLNSKTGKGGKPGQKGLPAGLQRRGGLRFPGKFACGYKAV